MNFSSKKTKKSWRDDLAEETDGSNKKAKVSEDKQLQQFKQVPLAKSNLQFFETVSACRNLRRRRSSRPRIGEKWTA